MDNYIYNPQTYFDPKVQLQASHPYHSSNFLIWVDSRVVGYDKRVQLGANYSPDYPHRMRLSGHATTQRGYQYFVLNVVHDSSNCLPSGHYGEYNIVLYGSPVVYQYPPIYSYYSIGYLDSRSYDAAGNKLNNNHLNLVPSTSSVALTSLGLKKNVQYELSGKAAVDPNFIYPTTGSPKFNVFFYFVDDNSNIGSSSNPWPWPDVNSSVQSTPTEFDRHGVPIKTENIRSNKKWVEQPSYYNEKGLWVDASKVMQFNGFYKENYHWKDTEPTVDTTTFKMSYNSSLINKFRETKKDVYCYITKNYQSYFYGIVQKNWVTSSSTRLDWIEVKVSDFSDLLKTSIRTTFTVPTGTLIYTTLNSTLSNPTCVLDKLFANYANGKVNGDYFVDGKSYGAFPRYNVTSAAAARLNVPLESGMTITVDDKKEYYEIFTELLKDYGCTFHFDDSGTMQIETVKEVLNRNASFYFNNSNMIGSLKSEKKQPQYEGAKITYNAIKQDGVSTIYKETSGGGSTYDCIFAISPTAGSNWYPVSTTQTVEQTITIDGLDDDKLLAIDAPWFTATTLTHGTITGNIPYFSNYMKDTPTSGYTTFYVSGYNASTALWKVCIGQVGPKTFLLGIQNLTASHTASPVTLTSFKIYGGIIHTSDSAWCEKIYDTFNNKLYEDTLTWCHDPAVAQDTANVMASYFQNADYKYTLKSRENVATGITVFLSDTNEPLVNKPCVVVSKKYKEFDGDYEYELEGLDDLVTHSENVEYQPESEMNIDFEIFQSPMFENAMITGDEEVTPTVIYRPQPINQQAEKIADSLVRYPTKSESMVDGWIDDQSTNIPSKPVVYGKVSYRNIYLFWNRQTTLTNLSHYEVQVKDGSSWYQPLNTDNFIGEADTSTLVYTEAYQHIDIPWKDDANRTLYYKVRAVTKSGATSEWSDTVGFTTFKVRVEDQQSVAKLWNGNGLIQLASTTQIYIERETTASGSLTLSGVISPEWSLDLLTSGSLTTSGSVAVDSIDRNKTMSGSLVIAGSFTYSKIDPFYESDVYVGIPNNSQNCKLSSTESIICWPTLGYYKVQNNTNLSTQISFTSSTPSDVRVRYISDNYFLIVYMLDGVKAKVASYNGGIYSFSSEYSLATACTSFEVSEMKNNKFILSLVSSDEKKIDAVCLTVSGMTLSVGSSSAVNSWSGYYIYPTASKACWIDTDKFLMLYYNNNPVYRYLQVKYGSVSGSDLTMDAPYTIDQFESSLVIDIASKSSTEAEVVFADNDHHLQRSTISVSGRTLNVGSPIEVDSSAYIVNAEIHQINDGYGIQYSGYNDKTYFKKIGDSIWSRTIYNNYNDGTFCYLGNNKLHEAYYGYITSTSIY